MKALLILPFLFLVGCATVSLPKESREFSFIEPTSIKQKDAYNSALVYLAKNLGDSNLAVKIKDSEAGTIITEIAVDCPELKIFMDMNRHVPLYNLEVQTKDNKIRFLYEGLSDRIYNAVGGALIGSHVISTAAQAAAIKTCAERNKSDIVKAINNRGNGKDW